MWTRLTASTPWLLISPNILCTDNHHLEGPSLYRFANNVIPGRTWAPARDD